MRVWRWECEKQCEKGSFKDSENCLKLKARCDNSHLQFQNLEGQGRKISESSRAILSYTVNSRATWSRMSQCLKPKQTKQSKTDCNTGCCEKAEAGQPREPKACLHNSGTACYRRKRKTIHCDQVNIKTVQLSVRASIFQSLAGTRRKGKNDSH